MGSSYDHYSVYTKGRPSSINYKVSKEKLVINSSKVNVLKYCEEEFTLVICYDPQTWSVCEPLNSGPVSDPSTRLRFNFSRNKLYSNFQRYSISGKK